MKPYHKPVLKRLKTTEISQDLQESLKPTHKLDVRDYNSLMQEILLFYKEQMSKSETENQFEAMQAELEKLQKKLELAHQSSPKQASIPELWSYALVVYDLILQQGMQLDEVLTISNAKLIEMATQRQSALREKASRESSTAYFIERKGKTNTE